MALEIGLAASTRPWGDHLHRFLLNHGGATVRGRMMSSDQAVTSPYDILLIDDICSYLSPRLVIDLRSRGKSIIGVFDPSDGPDAKRRLLEVGISDVIEADATPEEFLAEMTTTRASSDLVVLPADQTNPKGFVIAVTGPPGGVGVTEVAVGLSRQLSQSNDVALLDLNQSWPSLGQRLGLPVHPNLRTAIDLVHHEPDRVDDGVHHIQRLSVVTGLANPDGGTVPTAETATLVSELGSRNTQVVVDMGPMSDRTTDLILSRADVVLVVGLADPVGIARLVRCYERVAGPLVTDEIGVLVNRVPNRRVQDEIHAQLMRSLGDVPVFMVPEDRKVAAAGWDGVFLTSGGFAKSMSRLADLFQRAGD